MADKKTPSEKDQFEAEVYKLGLTLIEDYRTGRTTDRNKTLAAIVELFKISRGISTEGISYGI